MVNDLSTLGIDLQLRSPYATAILPIAIMCERLSEVSFINGMAYSSAGKKYSKVTQNTQLFILDIELIVTQIEYQNSIAK